MEKLDLKKQLKHLYNPSKREFSIVDVPSMSFVMIDGHGNPNTSQEYKDALTALYGLSYTLKFASKKQLGIDFTVMALEGLWWTEDMEEFSTDDKDSWLWTMMMMQPDHITAELVQQAREELTRKKDPPSLPEVRFERYHEGLSAQIMYIGPYADEGPTIARLHDFIREAGYELHGKHHEIYVGDPRRTAPDKLKTVIRQPMRRP
jgi:hypothetical protein